jgi:hypothetical protein
MIKFFWSLLYDIRHLYSLFNIQACNLIRLIMTKSNIFCIYFLFKHYFKGINKFFIMENTNNKLKTIIMSVKHLLKCMRVIVITSCLSLYLSHTNPTKKGSTHVLCRVQQIIQWYQMLSWTERLRNQNCWSHLVRGNWSFYWCCGNCWRLLSFRILNWD